MGGARNNSQPSVLFIFSSCPASAWRRKNLVSVSESRDPCRPVVDGRGT